MCTRLFSIDPNNNISIYRIKTKADMFTLPILRNNRSLFIPSFSEYTFRFIFYIPRMRDCYIPTELKTFCPRIIRFIISF